MESKNVCFCPCSGYENCPRRGGGSKNGKILYSVHVVVEFEKILAYMAGLTMTNLSANLV